MMSPSTMPLMAFAISTMLSSTHAASSASGAPAAPGAGSPTVRGLGPGAASIINVADGRTTYVPACPTNLSPDACKNNVQTWTATDGPPSFFAWHAIDVHNDEDGPPPGGAAGGAAGGPPDKPAGPAHTAAPSKSVIATVTQEATCSVDNSVLVGCKYKYSGTGLVPEEQAIVDQQNKEQAAPATRMSLIPQTVVGGADKLAAAGTSGTSSSASGSAGAATTTSTGAASGSRASASVAKPTTSSKSGASSLVAPAFGMTVLASALVSFGLVLTLA